MINQKEVARHRAIYMNHTLEELNALALRIGNQLIKEFPNVWQEELDKSNVHKAVIELIKEKKDNEKR